MDVEESEEAEAIVGRMGAAVAELLTAESVGGACLPAVIAGVDPVVGGFIPVAKPTPGFPVKGFAGAVTCANVFDRTGLAATGPLDRES